MQAVSGNPTGRNFPASGPRMSSSNAVFVVLSKLGLLQTGGRPFGQMFLTAKAEGEPFFELLTKPRVRNRESGEQIPSKLIDDILTKLDRIQRKRNWLLLYSKGIYDFYSFNLLAVIQVFGKEHTTPGFGSGAHD